MNYHPHLGRSGQMFAAAVVMTLFSACTDSSTGPRSSEGFRAPKALSSATPDEEEIIITRTTDIDPDKDPTHYKGKKSHRTTVQTLKHGSTAVKVAGGIPKAVELTVESLNAGSLPLPALTAPSRRSQAQRGAWTKSRPVSFIPGAIMETRGYNDEPASETRLIENGEVTTTILQKWRRGRTHWELVRQETTNATGSVQDVIDIVRRGGVYDFDATHFRASVPSLSTFSPIGPSFDEECSGGDGYTGADPCATQAEALESAQGEALIAAAAVLLCAPSEVIPLVGTYVCALAVLNFAKKLNDRDRAQTAYDKCRAYYATQKSCDPNIAPFDESSIWEPGTGGSEADAELSGYTECKVYYEFDKATGDITYLQVLYCW